MSGHCLAILISTPFIYHSTLHPHLNTKKTEEKNQYNHQKKINRKTNTTTKKKSTEKPLNYQAKLI
jgi:hypothetical protein